MRTRNFQEATLLQHVPSQPPQHLRPRMLEPLEFSCRIQGLEQPRVTPNLDLDAMPDARLWEMGAVPEMESLRIAKPFSWQYAPVVS